MPLAAAAALLLAVVLWPRHESQVQTSAGHRSADLYLPSSTASRSTPPSSVSSAPGATTSESSERPGQVRTVTAARERQVVTAADLADESPVAGFPRVPAITIQDLSVPQIRSVAAAAAPERLGVDAIATPAPIDVEPLPLSPRERHDQE